MDNPLITGLLALAGLGVGYIAWRFAPGGRRKRGAFRAMGLGAALPICTALAAPPAPVLGVIWLWLLLALAICDLRCRRLPDVLTGPLFGVALSWVWAGGAFGMGQALLAAGIGAGALWGLRAAYWLLRGREGLGLGDVKLMAGIAAATGLAALPWITLLAALAALAVAAITRAEKTAELPFGTYLAGAAGLVWLLSG